MQARLTAHPPAQAAIVATVRPGASLRIGRAADCGLRIEHSSVSRAHAALVPDDLGWTLRDLRSKNGTFVHGERIDDDHPLRAPAWLRFGDVLCEFSLQDEAEAEAEAVVQRKRRDAATAHTARIAGIERLDALLDASLRGVLELSDCTRGFVLLRAGDDFLVRASLALDAGALRDRGFSGSVGAVQRVLDAASTVVANDISREAWLRERQSVVASGLDALVCVPLRDGEAVIGAIYADRTRPGTPLTTLDQELLEAFAERAALWIVARQAAAELDAAPPAPPSTAWRGIVAAHGSVP